MSPRLRSLARALGALSAVVAAAVVLTGCGGGEESSAESWANDVCSSLDAWVRDVDESVQSLRGAGLSVNEDVVRASVGDISDATSRLADDLEELGPPDTEAGEQAKSEVDGLTTKLRAEVEKVRETVDSGSGATAVVSTVGMSLSTAAVEVQSTFNNLEGLDPGGELEDGFNDADECDTLRERLEELGS